MARIRLLPLIALLVLVLSTQGIPTATAQRQPGRSTPATTPVATPQVIDCDAVDTYIDFIRESQPELINRHYDTPLVDLRPSQQRSLARDVDAWVAELEAMDDVPAGMEAFHEAVITRTNLLISVLNALASGNPDGALTYGKRMLAADEKINAMRDRADMICHP